MFYRYWWVPLLIGAVTYRRSYLWVLLARYWWAPLLISAVTDERRFSTDERRFSTDERR